MTSLIEVDLAEQFSNRAATQLKAEIQSSVTIVRGCLRVA
jgi:hypothetical protein